MHNLACRYRNADYSDQVRQRMANTASAFYDVLEAKAMLKLAQEDLASLDACRTRSRGPASASAAPERSRPNGFGSRCSTPSAMCEPARRRSRPAKAQFRAAIGRRLSAPECDVAGSLDVPKAATPLSVTQAVAIAEQSRPDIVSLRRQIAKARSAITVEQTKAWPTVAPSLGYQYQYQECNGVADANAYTAQVSVSVPLFDRNQGNIAKAESALAQSCFNLQAQLVQTEADIEQAVAEFQAAYTDVTFDRRGTTPGRPQRPRSHRSRVPCGGKDAAGSD